MGPPCEALRIAVDQPRLRITNVTFLDKATAQCAAFVRTRDAVINQNEPNSLGKSASGESQIGTHVHFHPVRCRLNQRVGSCPQCKMRKTGEAIRSISQSWRSMH